MDRVIVYTGQLPQDTDVLSTNLFGLVNDGFKNQAFLGTTTVVAGLACTPTTPVASLQVNVGVGTIFQIDPVDATAYGSLGTNALNIMKQGILSTAQTLSITPPGTTGFSQVYLVEAILNDVDAGLTVLSYYNSANIQQPFSGPANSGTSQNTIRQCNCVIALKAGVPAATGSQVTPTVDAGYVPLFAITVANGQTQITSGNIVQQAAAPFFPTLPSIPGKVQGQSWVYAGTDTGAANAYVITFGINQPVPTAYTAGMKVSFKAVNANTAASTVNVNGLGAVNIRRASGVALASGDISAGQILELTYDGTNFQMANYIGSGSITNTNTSINIPYVADTGTQNALVGVYSPAIASYTDGLVIAIKLANAITGAATINANALGAKAIVLGDNTNPPFNVFTAGMDLLLIYSTALGKFQVVNVSSSMFYPKPTGNYNIYVNTSTGSDSLYDGTSVTVGTGTSGPFKTIGKAMTTAFGYAPSGFTITIQVAAGTYNESVTTPLFAGPNVTINGASAASVTVSSGNAHSVIAQGPNTLTANNITIQNAGVNGNIHGFVAQGGADLIVANCASNAITGSVFFGISGGTVFPSNHTFNGSCSSWFEGADNGTVYFKGGTFTASTAVSVTTATAFGYSGGIVTGDFQNFSPPSFVNPSFVSGPKYLAQLNGIVNVSGAGFNYFPGTVAGSTNTQGLYQP